MGIIALTVGMAIAGQMSPSRTTPDVPVQVVGSASDIADLAWAQSRFATAGLDTPEIGIEFHDAPEPCDGNMGTVRTSASGTLILRVCADHPKPSVRQSWRRRTLVHELAHVWEAQHLDGATRDAFMELRGLHEWNNRSLPWAERATEHAAEIITWGIGDPSWRFDARPQSSCDEMAAGYHLLTGSAAPREDIEGCD
jgi:hypothetical protein